MWFLSATRSGIWLFIEPSRENQGHFKAIKKAMELIEYYKPELKDSLPKDEYFKLYTKDDRSLPKKLAENI